MDYCGIGSDLTTETIMDLDCVEADKLVGHDVAFCLMGHFPEEVSVLHEMMDELAVEKENHLHCSNIVRMLAEVGCKHVHLLSVASADPEANSALLRARGKAEDAVVAAHFVRAVIYRPGYIKGKTSSSVTDVLTQAFLPAMEMFGPTDASINIETVVHAMVNTALSAKATDLLVLENAGILQAGGSDGDGIVPEIMTYVPKIDDMIAEADKEAAWQVACNPDTQDTVLEMFDFGKDEGDDDGPKIAQRAPAEDEDMFKDIFGAAPADGSKRATRPPRNTSALETLRQSSRTVPVIGRLVPAQTRDFGVQTA